MPKLTEKTALLVAPDAGDLLHVVDISDVTGSAEGTSKKITTTNLFTDLAKNSEKAVANGIATLNGSGELETSQIPASLLSGTGYQGLWDANANNPTITSGVGTTGDFYIVSVAGTTTIDGISSWAEGDRILFNGTAWEKLQPTDAVASVFGRVGVVVAANGDYTASQVTNVPAGNIAAATVQAAIDELDSEKEATVNKTAGSVLFAGATGGLEQDNANLYWDDNNNRLGVGTSTPSKPLEVNGEAKIGAYTLPAVDGASNQVLKTNGLGIVTWQDDTDTDAVTSVFGRTGAVVAATSDYNLDQVDQGTTTKKLSSAEYTDLTDAGDSTLHFHATDRARANHTGTQAHTTISDYDTELAGTTNTTAFTPTADYHPATKKYVDDSTGGGGGIVSKQTGYASSATSVGAGEDARYIDIAITAVTDVDKVTIDFFGGAGASETNAFTAGEHVTARLTSTTNLRIATPAAKANIAGRWAVIEWT